VHFPTDQPLQSYGDAGIALDDSYLLLTLFKVIQTQMTFVHSGDRFAVTITSDEILGEMSGAHTSMHDGSGWDKVWGLVRQPLDDQGALALGVPCGQYDEIFAHLIPLEPNEADGWASYLYEVRANWAVGEPLGVVALNEFYEVVEYWRMPFTTEALDSSVEDGPD